MKAKAKETETIKGMDAELAALLPGYAISNWETRRDSRGSSSLYIRCKALVAPVKIEISK